MNRPYIIDGGSMGGETTQVRVLRGRTQFDIAVTLTAIKGTNFGKEYLLAAEAREGDGHMDRSRRAMNCIAEHCLPVMQQLSSETSILGLSLEDLVQSRLYALEIVRDGESDRISIRGADSFSIVPASDISPLNVANMDASCKTVHRFPAKCIIVGVDSDVGGPRGQIKTSDGQILHLKLRENGREREFDRELPILVEIDRNQLSKGCVKLPKLHGIVVSGVMCVGFLIDLIEASPEGADLMCPRNWTRSTQHSRWEQQVKATSEVLHAHGLVWGDVNAGNVVIDKDDNAWVIDFGGRNNPWFVDDDKTETLEGDLQGVRRLFQEWLPKRRDGLPF